MKYSLILLIIFFINILSIQKINAQKASLSGLILDFDTGVGLPGANIIIKNVNDKSSIYGVSSDRDGFYSITNINPGLYDINISYIGFESYNDTISFMPEDKLNLSKSLNETQFGLDELIVEQKSSATSLERGAKVITSIQLSRIPTPAASGDLVNYLQVLPGVVSLGNRGGQVFVRGGTPSENMVLVDGMLIYKPFHILSFFSPFPDGIVSKADFYPGGFGAEFSGRTSSVLNIKMKNGDRFDYKSNVSISPFIGDITIQGPIKKGETSFITSLKESFIDETSALYLNEKQPIKFSNQYLKISRINDSAQCIGMFLRTYDRGKIDSISDNVIDWKNLVLGGKCESVNDEFFVRVTANISNMNNSSINSERRYTSNITQLKASLDLSWYRNRTRTDIGFFVRQEWINFDLNGSVTGIFENELDPLSGGAYFQLMVNLFDNFELEPGLSITSYTQLSTSFEPRLRMKWLPFGNNGGELTGAFGLYRQMVVGFTDQRDATGTFVTWTLTPFKNKLPKAYHYILGWRNSINNNFSYSTEIFYKKIFNNPIPVWNTVARFNTELMLADGDIYGADIRIEYQNSTFYTLISYGYTNTTYSASEGSFGVWFGKEINTFNPAHDRRHQLNGLVSKTFNKFILGIRWQYGSGIPYNQPVGFDEIIWFDKGLPDVNEQSGTTRILVDRPFNGRLPAYHSLDISLEKSFNLSTNNFLFTKIGVINAYDHANIFYYDLYTQKRVNQLPVTAYISLKLEIK